MAAFARSASLAAALCVAATFGARTSRASCGGGERSHEYDDPHFARRAAALSELLPRTHVERALILFHEDQETEHLVREVSYDPRAPFSMVIPVPSAAVVVGDGRALLDAFATDDGDPSGAGWARPASSTSDPDAELRADGAQRVGGLVAWTLAPMALADLDRWLERRSIPLTGGGLDELERRTRLGFHFVVLRHTPDEADPARLRSDGIHVRFRTPTAYYPYRDASARAEPRALWVTMIAERPAWPITFASGPSGPTPVVPWVPLGLRRIDEDARAALPQELAALLPDTRLAFRWVDYRESRVGFGDVLAVPSDPLGKLEWRDGKEGVAPPTVVDGGWRARVAALLSMTGPFSDEVEPPVKVASPSAMRAWLGVSLVLAGCLGALLVLLPRRRARSHVLGARPVALTAILALGTGSCHPASESAREFAGWVVNDLGPAPWWLGWDPSQSVFAPLHSPRANATWCALALLDGDVPGSHLPRR